MRKRSRRSSAPWIVAAAALAALACGAGALYASSTGAASSVVRAPHGWPAISTLSSTESAEARAPSRDEADRAGSVDWAYWRSANPAIVAWVSVPGTAIDYAVVQAPENDPTYYLAHDVYGNPSPYGCPYVDAGCDGIRGSSVVVFGHNMGSTPETVFADFARLSDEAFAQAHPTILLETPEGSVELAVSAVDVVEGGDPVKATGFESAEAMRAWYAKRFSECDVRIRDDPQAERLYTFVTCSYTRFADERTLVYAQPAR